MEKLRGILFVDDSITANFYHQDLFEELDIANEIAVVEDGLEALEFLKTKGAFKSYPNEYPQPSIIFLDVNMPRMDGLEFLAAYSKIPKEQNQGQVIIMLTTSLLEDDKTTALSYDFVADFWNKPIDEITIVDRIKSILTK